MGNLIRFLSLELSPGLDSMVVFSYRSRAYWSETDATGIVHFSNFFRYCERAEEEFFKSILGGFPDLLSKHGIIVPRVRASCSYSFPIFPHDDFRVDIVDVALGRKSIAYKFEIYNESKGNVKSAECEVIVAIVNPSIMKSVEIPEALRTLLKTFGARDKELIGGGNT